ncbi:MAG: dihydrolipoyl dehydrogenase [Verrucomicrobia bacterium]|nr:dihydrolipoyl dehydrogenase [Verrucomicrobiota bacterium]
MAEMNEYNLVVIGGGPAGYAGAIRAGQLGKKVACVEMDRPGGTCLNWGCIPSKALLKSAELYQKMLHAADFGLSADSVGFDFEKVVGRSRKVADQMASGIEFLFRKNKVDHLRGLGQITVPGMVEIKDGPDKGKFLKAKNILIATGCKMRPFPGLELDGERVMTSREALANKKQPESILIVGAGAIGVEFAYFYNALGTKVTLVEVLDQVLPVEDLEVAKLLGRSFKKQGIHVHIGTSVENVKLTIDGVSADLVKGEKVSPIEVDAVLSAIGVVPNLEGAVSSKIKLDVDRGYLTVNDAYATNVEGIYAAGDIIGPPWLAHVATYEAIQAVNGMFGAGKPKRVTLFPGCTYCLPQVASIGKTEQAVKESGVTYKIGKFPFSASGKAVASNASEGFVKVISSDVDGEILGVHIIGADATELIAEYALAMHMEATPMEIHETIHAHPTLSEALMEAAADTENEAIHI